MIEHIGIIGLGSIGRRHLRILKAMRPEMEITVVRSGKSNRWPEEKLANRIVYTIEEAIKLGIRAAIISSPASKHISQARILAEAGVNLFIEKPLSCSMDGIKDLIHVSEKNKIVGLVGYVMRHDPAAKKFNEYIKSGLIGKIIHVSVECGSFLPNWRPEQNYKNTVSASRELGGGVLLELSHELDYLRWFFGEMTHVFAHLSNSGTLDINVEESADLIFTSEAGYPISVHLDFNRRNPIRKCVIQGTNGELAWNAIEQNVSWCLVGENIGEDSFEFERDDIYQWQLEHFLKCVNNEHKPIVSIDNGGGTVKLIEAAIKSYKTGQMVVLT